MVKKYSDKEVLEWYDKYLELGSIKKLNSIGINGCTAFCRFKQMGLKLNVNLVGKRIRKFRENFFSYINIDSLYWAGFIAADGCASVNKTAGSKYLSIGLAKKDQDHICKFAKAIDFDGSLKNSSISICSEKIFYDLERFNIVPRKTFIYSFPEWIIDHNLVSHFIRGYCDGDGSFYVCKMPYKNKMGFSLCGTYSFLETCLYVLSKNCDINPNIKIRKTKSIYCLEYCGNKNFVKIRDFLYKDSSNDNRLDRKYNIAYNDWIDKKNINPRCRSVIGVSTIDNSNILLRSISDAKKYKFTRSGIQACLSKKQKTHRGFVWRYIDNCLEQ